MLLGVNNPNEGVANLDEVDFGASFNSEVENQEVINAPTAPNTSGANNEETIPTPDPATPPNEEEALETPAEETEPKTEELPKEEVEPTPLIKEVIELAGFEDLEGDFDDSPQGLAQMSLAIGQRAAQEHLDEFYEANPQLKEIYDFVVNGGNISEYMQVASPDVDYSKIEITKENFATQEAVLRAAYKSRGIKDEEITEAIEELKANGGAFTQAKLELKTLTQEQKESKERLVGDQKKARENADKEAEQFWIDMGSRIKKANDFEGIAIAEKDKDDFIEFLSKPSPDLDGATRRDAAIQQLTESQHLMLDGILYLLTQKKVSLDKIISTKATTLNAANLRDRLEQDKKTSSGERTVQRSNSQSTGVEDLDLTDISI